MYIPWKSISISLCSFKRITSQGHKSMKAETGGIYLEQATCSQTCSQTHNRSFCISNLSSLILYTVILVKWLIKRMDLLLFKTWYSNICVVLGGQLRWILTYLFDIGTARTVEQHEEDCYHCQTTSSTIAS